MRLLALLLFLTFDYAAYKGGESMGVEFDWYHALPGGGFVCLIQGVSGKSNTVTMASAGLPSVHGSGPNNDR